VFVVEVPLIHHSAGQPRLLIVRDFAFSPLTRRQLIELPSHHLKLNEKYQRFFSGITSIRSALKGQEQTACARHAVWTCHAMHEKGPKAEPSGLGCGAEPV
jgi:hypothetical protein